MPEEDTPGQFDCKEGPSIQWDVVEEPIPALPSASTKRKSLQGDLTSKFMNRYRKTNRREHSSSSDDSPRLQKNANILWTEMVKDYD